MAKMRVKKANKGQTKVIPIRKTVYVENVVYRRLYSWSVLTAAFAAGILVTLWLM